MSAVTTARTPTRRIRPALRRRPLLALVALALVVRIAVVIATPHFIPVTDAGEFDGIAVTLAKTGSYPYSYVAPHGGPTAFRPPLFPVALAGVYAVVGTGDAHTRWDAGRVLEAVLGALAVWLAGLIATRLWGWRVGLVSAGIAAIYPPLVLVGSSLLSESLFIPLVLASVWAALVFRDDGRLRWALTAGIFVGLSALTRGNGILVAIPVAFLVWTGRPRRSRRALKPPALVLAAAVLTLVPWTVRNLELFHRFVPVTTETGYALVGTYNRTAQDDHRFPALWLPPRAQMAAAYAAHPRDTEAQVSSLMTSQALRYIRAHPTSLTRTLYWNTLRLLNLTGTPVERLFAGGEGYPLWLALLSVYAFWVLLALTLAGLHRRVLRPAPAAVWGVPLAIYVTTAPLLGLTRYRSPADPFLIMLAAAWLVSVGDRLHGRLGARRERAEAERRERAQAVASIGAR